MFIKIVEKKLVIIDFTYICDSIKILVILIETITVLLKINTIAAYNKPNRKSTLFEKKSLL